MVGEGQHRHPLHRLRHSDFAARHPVLGGAAADLPVRAVYDHLADPLYPLLPAPVQAGERAEVPGVKGSGVWSSLRQTRSRGAHSNDFCCRSPIASVRWDALRWVTGAVFDLCACGKKGRAGTGGDGRGLQPDWTAYSGGRTKAPPAGLSSTVGRARADGAKEFGYIGPRRGGQNRPERVPPDLQCAGPLRIGPGLCPADAVPGRTTGMYILWIRCLN